METKKSKLKGRPLKMPHEQIREYWKRRSRAEPWVTKAEVARELKISRRHLYAVINGEYSIRKTNEKAGIPATASLIVEWT